MGVMFADLYVEGKQPKEDRLKRADGGEARMAEQDLRTWALMPPESITEAG